MLVRRNTLVLLNLNIENVRHATVFSHIHNKNYCINCVKLIIGTFVITIDY